MNFWDNTLKNDVLLKFVVAIFVTIITMEKAYSQPFGVTQGSAISRYNPESGKSNSIFVITPPTPHPDFDQYIAVSTPKTGICAITGISTTIKNDAYGISVQSIFEDVSKQLQIKYGNSRKFDFLLSGSIWNEPKDWAMALYKRERTLDRFWSVTQNSTLSGNIKGILLEAKSVSSSDTYVTVRFEFNNIDECRSIIDHEHSNAF